MGSLEVPFCLRCFHSISISPKLWDCRHALPRDEQTTVATNDTWTDTQNRGFLVISYGVVTVMNKCFPQVKPTFLMYEITKLQCMLLCQNDILRGGAGVVQLWLQSKFQFQSQTLLDSIQMIIISHFFLNLVPSRPRHDPRRTEWNRRKIHVSNTCLRPLFSSYPFWSPRIGSGP